MNKHTPIAPGVALVTVGGGSVLSVSFPPANLALSLSADALGRLGRAALDHAGAAALVRPVGTPLPLPPAHLIPIPAEIRE